MGFTGVVRLSGEEVEERLIEAVRVLSRGARVGPTQGSGWAGDAPWELSAYAASRTEAARRYWEIGLDALALGERRDLPPGREPTPDREAVDRAMAASAWLRLIPDEAKRVLVRATVVQMARTGQPAWREVVRDPQVGGTVARARMAYGRAIEALAKAVSKRGGVE